MPLRILSLVEVKHALYSLAARIADETNVTADAGERCDSLTNWLNFLLIFRLRGSRYRSRAIFEIFCAQMRIAASIVELGGSGHVGASSCYTMYGSQGSM